MKHRRFIIDTHYDDEGYAIVDVKDLLTKEVVGTFSHEWRAEKRANELMREAERNGEKVIVDI